MTNANDEGVQTHEDVPEIPEGVAIPDSSGSLTENVEEPEEVDYSDVEDVPAPVNQAAEADDTDETEEV